MNLSYTTSPLKKFQTNYFMDPNQIHLKIEFLTFMEIIVSKRLSDEPTSLSLHFHWDEQVFLCLNSQLPMWIGQVIAYLNPKRLVLVWGY